MLSGKSQQSADLSTRDNRRSSPPTAFKPSSSSTQAAAASLSMTLGMSMHCCVHWCQQQPWVSYSIETTYTGARRNECLGMYWTTSADVNPINANVSWIPRSLTTTIYVSHARSTINLEINAAYNSDGNSITLSGRSSHSHTSTKKIIATCRS